MASPSRRRRRQRRRRKRAQPVPLAVFHTMPLGPPPPPPRDWAELPLDAILHVLRRLDHVDILMGAGLACRSWRGAARDEPELWRRIDMRGFARLPWEQPRQRLTFRAMAREAVRRSAGRCELFWSKVGGDDEVLRFPTKQAPSLRSLRLIKCSWVTKVGLLAIIHYCPLLETLDTPGCYIDRDDDTLRGPLLETLDTPDCYDDTQDDDTLQGKELSIRVMYGWRSSSHDGDDDDVFIVPPSPCTCCWSIIDSSVDESYDALDLLEYGRYFNDIHETEFDDEQDYRKLNKGDRKYLKAEGWTWSG